MTNEAIRKLYSDDASADSALPKLLSPKELAKYLHKSKHWVERSRWDGTGPKFLKLGGHCYYREQDVVEWMNNKEQAQTANSKRT